MLKQKPKLRVDFQINGICNARCDFCKIWENPVYNEKILPAEHWIKTARDLKKFSDVEHICIGGGEPFMYKELYNVIKGIRELGIVVSIVTNGSLLSEKNSTRLVDAEISHIDFSIDSFAEKHNRMRGIPNLFEKCVWAMSYLKKLNPNLSIGISTIMLEDNIYDLPEFVEWAIKEPPINYIHFQAYNQVLTHHGEKQWWKNDPLWPKDREAIIQVMKYLKKRKLEGAKISNPASQFEKYIHYFLNPDDDLGIKCSAGTDNFSVSYKGDVHGCIKEMPAGNIVNDSPMQIYYGDFAHAREKASTCKKNCHFLVNCLFDVQEKKKEVRDSGSVLETTPIVYFLGNLSENNTFFSYQLWRLKRICSDKKKHHVVIGINKSNFSRLSHIYNLIRSIRKDNKNFTPSVLENLDYDNFEILYAQIGMLNQVLRKEGIEIRNLENGTERKKIDLVILGQNASSENKKSKIVPSSFYLHITARCNSVCTFCYMWKNKENDLDLKYIKKFLYGIEKYNTPNTELVIIGGEPTLREDLDEILITCRKLNFYPTIVTNGYKLADYNYAKKIVSTGIRSIVVSIDGFRETNDKLRGKGNFDKSIAAIKNMRNINKHLGVTVQCVISEKNFKELPDFVTWLSQTGLVNNISFQAISQNFSENPYEGWHLKSPFWPKNYNLLCAKIDELIKLKQEIPLFFYNEESQFHFWKMYFQDPLQFKNVNECNIGDFHMQMNADGNIHLCPYKPAVGNIIDKDISELFYSANSNLLRKDISLCKDVCHYQTNCKYKDLVNKITV